MEKGDEDHMESWYLPRRPHEVSGENAHGCTSVTATNKHTGEKQNCVCKDEIHKSPSQPQALRACSAWADAGLGVA